MIIFNNLYAHFLTVIALPFTNRPNKFASSRAPVSNISVVPVAEKRDAGEAANTLVTIEGTTLGDTDVDALVSPQKLPAKVWCTALNFLLSFHQTISRVYPCF